MKLTQGLTGKRVLSLSLLVAAAMLPACGKSDQAKAIDEAKQVQSALQQMTPGAVATTADGFSMKAKLDGKDWVATSMMPQDLSSRIVGYRNGEYIGLPYDRRYLVVGNIVKFGENNAVDLSTKDDAGFWGGRQGQMQITRVDENAAEGTFYFTASSSGTSRRIEVTDGTFRIVLRKK